MTRLVSYHDYRSVASALDTLIAYSLAYKWAIGVSREKGLASIMQTADEGKAYIIDGFLVLVDEVTPWYSTEKILQEWLVLKVYAGGYVSSIPPALEILAKERGCVAVTSADSSPIQIMAKAYSSAGWQSLTSSFIKVL